MHQVLGLTSYSHWPEAAKLRECARSHGDIQHQLQQLTETRVKAMLHVGVMEELHLSIASLAVSCVYRAATSDMQFGVPSLLDHSCF